MLILDNSHSLTSQHPICLLPSSTEDPTMLSFTSSSSPSQTPISKQNISRSSLKCRWSRLNSHWITSSTLSHNYFSPQASTNKDESLPKVIATAQPCNPIQVLSNRLNWQPATKYTKIINPNLIWPRDSRSKMLRPSRSSQINRRDNTGLPTSRVTRSQDMSLRRMKKTSSKLPKSTWRKSTSSTTQSKRKISSNNSELLKLRAMLRVDPKVMQLPPGAKRNSKSKRVSIQVMATQTKRLKSKWPKEISATFHQAHTTRYLEKNSAMNCSLPPETTTRVVIMNISATRRWSKCIRLKSSADGTRGPKLKIATYFLGWIPRNTMKSKTPITSRHNNRIKMAVFSRIEESIQKLR